MSSRDNNICGARYKKNNLLDIFILLFIRETRLATTNIQIVSKKKLFRQSHIERVPKRKWVYKGTPNALGHDLT